MHGGLHCAGPMYISRGRVAVHYTRGNWTKRAYVYIAVRRDGTRRTGDSFQRYPVLCSASVWSVSHRGKGRSRRH
eukprot:SAG31_NODE_984_length_10552_cov_4.679231_1_plen_75_part_00